MISRIHERKLLPASSSLSAVNDVVTTMHQHGASLTSNTVFTGHFPLPEDHQNARPTALKSKVTITSDGSTTFEVFGRHRQGKSLLCTQITKRTPLPSVKCPRPPNTRLYNTINKGLNLHSFGSIQATRWRIHTAVTALLPYPRTAKQTRPCATSAPLHSVLPSTTTPEPRQAALATELVAICSAWSALNTQGPLAASNTLAYSPR